MTPPFHPSSPAGVSLATALRELADQVEQGDLADLPDAVIAQLVAGAASLSGRVDALLTRAIGVLDAKTIWRADGARSCAGWLAARTELSRARAAGTAATARDLRACPHLEAAYGSGAVGTAKVRLLLDARQAWPDRFADDEAELVALVAPLTVAHASLACSRWAALAEAARQADERERAGEEPDGDAEPDPALDNGAHLSKVGDRYRLDADYDAATGAEVAAPVQAWIDRQFDQGTYRADDGMLHSQRVAAAIADLTRRGAIARQTKHGDPRPSVSISIDARTLAGEPVRGLDDLASRRCSLDDGTPVARATAERLLCTARVAAMLVRIAADGTIETLGVTDLLRDATRKQHRALRNRDGGCTFPGCAAPPDWCEAHHIETWEDGGPTLLQNLALLCAHHHHLVHEGGWHLWRSALDGALHLARPDGSPVTLTPYGHLVDLQATNVEPPPPRPPRPRFETRHEHHEREHHGRGHHQDGRRPTDRSGPPSPPDAPPG